MRLQAVWERRWDGGLAMASDSWRLTKEKAKTSTGDM